MFLGANFWLLPLVLVWCSTIWLDAHLFHTLRFSKHFGEKWTPGCIVNLFLKGSIGPHFALDMTDACCVRRNFCTGKASFPALEVILDHPFRKKLFLGRQEKVFPVRVRSKIQTFSYLSPQPAITGQDSNLPRHADEGRKLASLSQFMMRGYRFWPIPHRFPEVQLLARMPKTTPLCLLSPSI